MRTILTILLVTTGAFICTSVGAEKLSINLTDNEISQFSPADTSYGHYYLFDFEIPQIVTAKNVYRVYLEVCLDISSNATLDYVNEAPVIEVYALTKSIKDQLRELSVNDLQ